MDTRHPKNRGTILRWPLALVLLTSLATTATTVYKTVDENGVVSFSDAKPQDDPSLETLEFNVPTSEPSADAQQRLLDMRATTDRMAADRMAREKHRAELKQIGANSQNQPSTAALPGLDYPLYPQYINSYLPRHRYPGIHPRPVPYRNEHSNRPTHETITPPLRSGRTNRVSPNTVTFRPGR